MLKKISAGLTILYKIFLIILFNAACLLCHAGIFILFKDFPMTGDSIAIGVLLGQIYVTKYIWKRQEALIV